MMTNEIEKINERILVAQSRSFSIPILNLEPKLKLPIMVEYNFNKLMDTIEDNPALDIDTKVNILNQINTAINNESSCAEQLDPLMDITPQDEVHVIRDADAIFNLYKELPPPMRTLSRTYCNEMSKGMIEFLNKQICSLKDLERYCYFVAGTVGMYLTDVTHFYYPYKEDLTSVKNHAKGYGQFLQKLNIIRDFHEDAHDKQRSFWPSELLEKHGKEDTFLAIVKTILHNDLPNSLKYYNSIPEDNTTYKLFNRFIILSSLEYLKLILKRKTVFAPDKLKLPRSFIELLYSRVKNMGNTFLDKCELLAIECHQLI